MDSKRNAWMGAGLVLFAVGCAHQRETDRPPPSILRPAAEPSAGSTGSRRPAIAAGPRTTAPDPASPRPRSEPASEPPPRRSPEPPGSLTVTITDQELEAGMRYVEPTPGELQFEQLPWFADLSAGLGAAQRDEKPLILWVMNGNPLACNCPSELPGQRDVWGEPDVLDLAEPFVVAVDEVWRLRVDDEPSAAWFREALASAALPGGTEPASGIYALAASGRLLAVGRSLHPEEVLDVLGQGLESWYALAPEERLLSSDRAALLRPAPAPPRGGLVLTCVARDLPPPGGDGSVRFTEWSRGQIWFDADEARAFVPAQPAPGARHAVPAGLVQRVAQFHLLDNVNGPAPPFGDRDVEIARLDVVVTGGAGSTVDLRLEGRTRCRGTTETALGGATERGVDVELLGRARFDYGAEEFTSFELFARGSRWGRTQKNARRGKEAASPIAYSVRLTPAGPRRAVPPQFLERYAEVDEAAGSTTEPVAATELWIHAKFAVDGGDGTGPTDRLVTETAEYLGRVGLPARAEVEVVGGAIVARWPAASTPAADEPGQVAQRIEDAVGRLEFFVVASGEVGVDLAAERRRLGELLDAAGGDLDRVDRRALEVAGGRYAWRARSAAPAVETPPFVLLELGPERFGSADVSSASANLSASGRPALDFELKPERRAAFGDFTRSNLDMAIAVVWNDVVLSSPVIRSPITKAARIECEPDAVPLDELQRIARAVSAGPPVRLRWTSVRVAPR